MKCLALQFHATAVATWLGCVACGPAHSPQGGTPSEVRQGGVEADAPYFLSLKAPAYVVSLSDGYPQEIPSPMGWTRDGGTYADCERRSAAAGFDVAHDRDAICWFRGEVFSCAPHERLVDGTRAVVDYHPSPQRGQALIPAFPFNVVGAGFTRKNAREYMAFERMSIRNLSARRGLEFPCLDFEVGVGGYCGEVADDIDIPTIVNQFNSYAPYFHESRAFEIDGVTRETVRSLFDDRIDDYTYDGGYVPLTYLRSGEAVWEEWLQLARLGPSAACVRSGECPVVAVVAADDTMDSGFDILYCRLHYVREVVGAPIDCRAIGYQDREGSRFLLGYFSPMRGGADGAPDLDCECPGVPATAVSRALGDEPRLGLTVEARSFSEARTYMVVGVRNRIRSYVWDGYRETSSVTIVGDGNHLTIASAVYISRQNTGSYHGLTDGQKDHYRELLATFARRRLHCDCRRAQEG